MFKMASVSGAPPQTPLGSLQRSLRPPSRKELLAFGNRTFASSALAIFQTRMFICEKTKNNSPPHSQTSRRLQHLDFCSPPICPKFKFKFKFKLFYSV